jgi:SAM-dependent methyltransferase
VNDDARRRWDARYRDRAVTEAAPARVVSEFAHLLPARGHALEVACGLGGNAVFLARRGLAVDAWDLSPVAAAKLAQYASEQGLPIAAAARDVTAAPPPPGSYDVVVVSRFLDRPLCPALAAALRPGGLLFYQTFVRAAVSPEGPGDPAHRLGSNELLRLFGGLTLLSYREEGAAGDIRQGWRDEAYLVGRAD